MYYLSVLLAILIIVTGGVTACAGKSKAKPLVPLALTEGGVKPQAITLTE